MKLSQLKMFVAVAESGSFSAAAAQLDCTQSRISHAIGELERGLGVRLLMRSHAGSVPTDIGHQVLDKARQMLRLERSLLDAARDSRALAGRVRIACFRSVGTHLLPHVVEALAHAHPALQVDIDDSCQQREDVPEALLRGRAELGIAQLPVAAGLVTQAFVYDTYMLVVPAALPIGAPVAWSQLDGLPFIQLGCSGADAVLERCRAAGFTAQAGRTLSNDTSIAAMVARGMGYSILPRLATYPEPDGVRTLALPIPARRQFVVAALPEVMRDPAVRAVARFIGKRSVLAATSASRLGIIGWD